jgi:hypothetical protein
MFVTPLADVGLSDVPNSCVIQPHSAKHHPHPQPHHHHHPNPTTNPTNNNKNPIKQNLGFAFSKPNFK